MPRVGMSGDFAKLKKIAKMLNSAPSIQPILAKNLADETIELIKEGIDSRADPYGKPYKSLALRSGRPLQDTGGLKGSWFRKLSSKGFTVESAKSYTIYHQLGTGIYGPKRRRITPKKARGLRIPMRGGRPIYAKSVAGTPQRKMIPDRGLPSKWRRRLIGTTEEIFLGHIRK